MKRIALLIPLLAACHSPPDAPQVKGMSSGPDPTGTGFAWGVSGRNQLSNFTCPDAAAPEPIFDGGYPICVPQNSGPTGPTGAPGANGSNGATGPAGPTGPEANGPDAICDSGYCIVLQATGSDGGFNFGANESPNARFVTTTSEQVAHTDSGAPVTSFEIFYVTGDGGVQSAVTHVMSLGETAAIEFYVVGQYGGDGGPGGALAACYTGSNLFCTIVVTIFAPPDGGVPTINTGTGTVTTASTCSQTITGGTYGATFGGAFVSVDAGGAVPSWTVAVQGVADAGSNCWVDWNLSGSQVVVK
jgi:hypothetical protein